MSLEPKQPMRLMDLTPRFMPARHGLYIDILTGSFADDKAGTLKLIALTGQFGTGKSSVIQGLRGVDSITKSNPTFISLGTIDPQRIGDRPDNTTSSGQKSASNIIQKEIVKQLLYSRSPKDMPLSRYRRLSHVEPGRLIGQIAGAAGIGAIVTAAGVWRGVLPVAAQIAVGALVAGLSWWVYRTKLSGRLGWSELKAGSGPGSLTLTNQSTWFDEYMDEIVYFFDSSGCRLVVFEDLDRFEDPHIFEMLRELNTLLNNADQLKRPDRQPIRFLCAIRDSVFGSDASEPSACHGDATPRHEVPAGRLGDADSEAARRIKLFDLVVPMVPFVSPRTSHNQFTELLQEDPQRPSAEVLRTVAQHVTDYRLMITIVNEYRILQQVVRADTGLQDLDPSRVFAMAAYKTLRPADYDQILAGSSPLNQVQKACDSLRVNAHRELSALESRVRRISGPKLSPSARTDLGTIICVLLQRLGADAIELAHSSRFDPARPDDLAFWTGAAEAGIQINGYRVSFVLQPDDLAQMAGEAEAAWDSTRNEAKPRDLKKLDARRRELTHATWADLMRPSRALHLESIDEMVEGFSLLDSDTGRQLDRFTTSLIAQGHVDSLFTLYAVRTDPGDLTAEALNYMISVVEDPKASPLFTYNFQDVGGSIARMLEAAGPEFLSDERCFNVQVFDHLLSALHSDSESDYVRTAAGPSEQAEQFRHLYRTSGDHAARFAELTAPHLTSAFTEIAGEMVEPDTLTTLLEASLAGSNPSVEYDTHDVLRRLLSEHLRKMTLWGRADPADCARMTHVLDELGYLEAELGSQPPQLATELIKRHMYLVNDANLRYLTGALGDEALSLDLLDPTQRDHINGYLDQYIDALRQCDDCRSIADRTQALSILNQMATYGAADVSPEQLGLLVSRMPDKSTLDLEDLDVVWWQPTVQHGRATITWSALSAYFARYHSLDGWGTLLFNVDPATISAPAADSIVPAELLIALLQLPELEKDQALRLVQSAGQQLSLDAIPPLLDPLLPDLVAHTLIDDDSAVYERLQGRDSEISRLIKISQTIPSYLRHDVLTQADVELIAASGRADLLELLLNTAHELKSLTETASECLLDYAVDHRRSVGSPQLVALGRNLADVSKLAGMLPALADGHTAAELLPLLDLLPGELKGVGRESIRVGEEHMPLVEFLKNKGLVTCRRLPRQSLYAISPRA